MLVEEVSDLVVEPPLRVINDAGCVFTLNISTESLLSSQYIFSFASMFRVNFYYP